MQGIQVIFLAIDCNERDCALVERIDSVVVDILGPVGTTIPETEYVGTAGLVKLNISFEVRCDDDFYGEDCLTFCLDFESCAGCGLPGYTGESCQFDINDCEDIDCHDGECIDKVNGFTCDCEIGFTGDLCQYNIDDCSNISCSNNGECADGVDSFNCVCEPGFTGGLCDININDCEDAECDDGECVDEIGGFSCECNPGFTGEYCDETDHCFGVSCSNNGHCENSPEEFTYSCICEPGFDGDMCQEESEFSAAVLVGVLRVLQHPPPPCAAKTIWVNK